ncbi:MAG: hypothetical protein R3C45_15510 [Phycisphaerales bacterium]
MDNPSQSEAQQGAVLIGAVAVLGAMAAAGVSWAMLGYWLAWKLQLSLGMILPPLVAGGVGGVIIRFGAQGALGRRTTWIAVAAVLMGCIVGDLVWIMLAQQKPLSVLLGPELRLTINAMTNLPKLVMYFFACYLAYAISVPPRPYVSE